MLSASASDNSRNDTVEFHERAVERTIVAMEEHLADDFPLEEMARVGIMSPYHFSRVFRQVTGVPPVRFLGARRLEAAKRLLLSTRMSVTDVCFEVGYNSLGTFTRRFTDLVGLPPRSFRALAEKVAAKVFGSFEQSSQRSRLRQEGLKGQVETPEGFKGLIFVGLFTSAIPQRQPVACAVLTKAGEFTLSSVEDGRYYLFAVGLAWSADPRDYLLHDKALRAGSSNRAVRIRKGKTRASTTLELRAPQPFDPPILMSFPQLLMKRLAAKVSREAGLDMPAVAASPVSSQGSDRPKHALL